MLRQKCLFIAIVLLLAGCAGLSTAPTATISELTQTVEPTPTETQTPIPSATPRPTETLVPTPTDTPAPPDDFIGTFLFQGTQYPTCELPCWRGLVIGESTLEDVQALLERDFRLKLIPQPSHVETLQLLKYIWSDSDMSFSVGFWIETQTQVLTTINFVWGGYGEDYGITPQRIIQELGAPDQWWFEFEDAMHIDSYDSAMVYDNGLIIMHQLVLTQVEKDEGILTEYCLDDEADFGSAFIVSPSEISLSETPSQPFDMEHDIASVRIDFGTTIEDKTGYTLDEMVALALKSSQPCVEFIE